jgi:hypothetical protein
MLVIPARHVELCGGWRSKVERDIVIVVWGGVVFSEGMAEPVMGKEDASQVGMPCKVHAYEVVGFSFVPESRRPNPRHRRHRLRL